MRKYEALYILNPQLEEEQLKELVEKFKGVVETNSGTITNLEEWGHRKLAYEVNNLREGYYVLMNFEAEPVAAGDLERVFKITDGLVKYLIIKEG
jgi:small subunit ribosomal protein S6